MIRRSTSVRRFLRVAALSLPLAVLASAPPAHAAAVEWSKVDAALLARTESPKFPGVNLEFDSWQEWLKEESWGYVRTVQVRAKVYTAQGVDAAVKFHAEIAQTSRLTECVARIVKRDGRAIAVMERTSPAAWSELVAGDVVEFRWSSKRVGEDLIGRYVCQQAFPIREYQLNVQVPGGGVQARWEKLSLVEQAYRDGGNARFMTWNVPARDSRPGATNDANSGCVIELLDAVPSPEWRLRAKVRTTDFETAIKVTPQLRKKAAELIAGATDDEDKIRRLHEFCRLKIENRQYPSAPGAAFPKIAPVQPKFTPAVTTLSEGKGTPVDIDVLFGALLQAAGFAPRRAESFSMQQLGAERLANSRPPFLRRYIALRRAEGWTFYQPGERLLPFGVIGLTALHMTAWIAEKDHLVFQDLPKLAPEIRLTTRRGRFTLENDGTLRGSVEMTRGGEEAASVRKQIRVSGQEDYNRAVATNVQKRLPGAVVSEIRCENVDTLDGPIVVRYNIAVPGYAVPTDGRLPLAPLFFVRNRPPLHEPVPGSAGGTILQAGWIEDDEVEIALPATVQPSGVVSQREVAEANGLTTTSYAINYAAERHTLSAKRHFVFDPRQFAGELSNEGTPALVQAFIDLAKADNHVVMLEPRP